MIILSDVDGLYDGPPKEGPAKLISTVIRIDDQVISYVRDRASGLSKGGMASKLQAARMATLAGEKRDPRQRSRAGSAGPIVRGETIGTAFLAQGKSFSPRKRWIGFSARPRGILTIDDGACQAIVQVQRSLLPSASFVWKAVFQKGDVVSLRDRSGRERRARPDKLRE